MLVVIYSSLDADYYISIYIVHLMLIVKYSSLDAGDYISIYSALDAGSYIVGGSDAYRITMYVKFFNFTYQCSCSGSWDRICGC